jgi:hypothetical protein
VLDEFGLSATAETSTARRKGRGCLSIGLIFDRIFIGYNGVTSCWQLLPAVGELGIVSGSRSKRLLPQDASAYAWAQFFPFLALVLILSLFPPKYTGASYWVGAATLYALAGHVTVGISNDAPEFAINCSIGIHTSATVRAPSSRGIRRVDLS